MADPYLPPQTGRPVSERNPNDPTFTDPARNEATRNTVAVNNGRSGLGVGLLVALVFVVVAVLAAALYNPGTDDVAPATLPAATEPAADTTAPATGTEPVIDGTTTAPATDAPAADAPITDAPATDGIVAPDAGTADPVAPAPAPEP